MKTCRRCKDAKEAAEFAAIVGMRDGLDSWCKARLRFCRPKCAYRFGANENRHMRRAQSRGGASERVLRSDVLARDGWHCQLCGDPIDPALSGREPYGLTLDHIVPLARGGDHTLDNVQLAHRICNMRKSANTNEYAVSCMHRTG